MKRPISFDVEARGEGLARAGVLHTLHGDIQTPAFIAVGTKATVKGIEPALFTKLGIQGIITNAYHLYLTPGESLVEGAGGVGAFMGYQGPTMTDSGGFQVFSLGAGMGKKVSKLAFEPALPDEGSTPAVSIAKKSPPRTASWQSSTMKVSRLPRIATGRCIVLRPSAR